MDDKNPILQPPSIERDPDSYRDDILTNTIKGIGSESDFFEGSFRKECIPKKKSPEFLYLKL